MDKQRFYIATRGNDDDAYHEAIEYAIKLANQDQDIKRVVLLVYTKQNVDWFVRLYGPEVVKGLFKGTKFKNCNASFQFETEKTYKDNYSPSEIVITCGSDSEVVSKIEDYYSVKAIIAIPWVPEKLQKWIQTWNPIELRGNQQANEIYPDPSCIVKIAMEDLTSQINITTGIHNFADKDRAKMYVLALHKYEPSLNANVVGAYLVRELGWKKSHAQDMENLINTLNNGKYFQGGQRTGLDHYYKLWREQCD